jgi:(1->4)-alpha-D-glucan 1-alpha-D-glucosylmutase
MLLGRWSMEAGAPRATYRVQLHAGFTLDDAAAIVDYLAALGVSHLYSSPIAQAVRGSAHGYDVVDHQRVSDELGGSDALRRLGDRLHEHGMAQILDVVPNHMAVDRANAWWWDVLENGASSRFAGHFDVDWEPPEARLRNLVFVPVLADHYGRVLEAGELHLERDRGRLTVLYHEHEFPIAPRSLDDLLQTAATRCGSDELAFLADAFGRLPLATATDYASTTRRHRDKRVLRRALAGFLASNPDAASAVDAVVAEWNADPDALHALLERQNYRLARWRAGERDLGYRRFFDVNDLVALRVEEPRVFAAVHQPLHVWRNIGCIGGLRIDHVDGLLDPARYLEKLRSEWPTPWIVVEKILTRDEALPDWPVAGTTGYEFLNQVGGLFVDPDGEKALTECYVAFTGETRDFDTIARDKKEQVLRRGLAPDLGRLTALAVEVCEQHRRYRDFTRHELHSALRACIVHFPVYRSYVQIGSEMRSADAQVIGHALMAARASRPDLDAGLFDFLAAILMRELHGPVEDQIVQRFQQLTAPAQAKGVEDAAYYVADRLASLAEVGGDPGRFGTTLAEFHAANRERLCRWPETLLATSTHDTKRSEDARARLALLSEIPEHFAAASQALAAIGEVSRCGPFPDRNTEWLYHQTLVATWPIETPRVLAYMQKAVREAGEQTSWTEPNEVYEAGMRRFVERTLADAGFVAALEAFVTPLVVPGRTNSLAQTLLKLSSPGVPDLYQGCELWDHSLVDPDNRRPVDYARRRALLASLEGIGVREIHERADEGLPKLWVIRQALALRRRRPECFGACGSYEPIEADGELARHVVAFSRARSVIAVAPRLVLGVARNGGFGDTTIRLPRGAWRDVLSERSLQGGRVRVAALLAGFPVALLESEQG